MSGFVLSFVSAVKFVSRVKFEIGEGMAGNVVGGLLEMSDSFGISKKEMWEA
jgi:hypothetical protein